MIDQKVVENLELGTDLEVDNPEACTESRVDLGVCTILKVENLEVDL